MTKVKLWITDIDGTIMNYDNTYTKRMENLIQKVQKRGIKFVLATGRMFSGADFVAKKFNLKTPVVCYQGAVVRLNDQILWQKPVKNNLVREIIDYLRKYKIHTHIYNDDILYIENYDKKIMDYYCSGRGTTYKLIDSFDEIKLNNVPKILGVIKNPEMMEKIKNELTEKYKGILTIVQSAPEYLEINDIGATKGEALNFLKKYWGISNDEVIASGDQDNDVDMLHEAGIKICVGSNSDLLKKTAQYCCKDVNSDELVDLIESIVLCG